MEQDNSALSVPDGVQRVEAEREPDPAGPAGGERASGQGAREGFSFRFASFGKEGIRAFASSPQPAGANPPRLAAWICLALAWLFLGSSVPFTVLLGVPLDLAALLLALVCMTRGGLFTGLAVLALGTAGSLVVYIVGLFRFLTQW